LLFASSRPKTDPRDTAKKNNIRLIVKNTGHDYLGRSSGPKSLSIWVHYVTGIKTHASSFQPKGCDFKIEGSAITAGAGTQMYEVYKAAGAVNRTVVGGMGRTVGLGGFISGAGHSILSPRYGLADDNVLEVEMVTPSGQIITANECQNTDLFWATRGVS
jgi:FAD/FMN-containing dehydrogenase